MARGICVLLALAVVCALFPVGMYHLVGSRAPDWLILGASGALICMAAALVLRLRYLGCPQCGGGVAIPQWRAGRRHYCPRCGAPFIYDDEPAETMEEEE